MASYSTSRFLIICGGILVTYLIASSVCPPDECSTSSRRKYSSTMEINRNLGANLETTYSRAEVMKGTSEGASLSAQNKLLEPNVLKQNNRGKNGFNKTVSRTKWPRLNPEPRKKLARIRSGQDKSSGRFCVNGTFWSKEAEDSASRENRDSSVTDLANITRETSVVKMVPGCGHSQNRLLTFQNGRQVCCRYRNSLDLIQGEMYTYSLSQILRIHNLPPTTVGVINVTGSKWDAVKANMTDADWLHGHQVIFSQWIPHLVPAFLPGVFLRPAKRLHPPDIRFESMSEISQLVQWSDMIVLDYLTGNMDRMVNMLVNQRWNSFIMDSPVHNLEQSTLTGQLFFLDNELSFIHGYRLLDRYGHFHREMLESLCVFRLGTVDTLQKLHRDGNVWGKMWDFATRSKLLKHFPKLSRKNIDILKSRLADVLDQVKTCKQIYSH